MKSCRCLLLLAVLSLLNISSVHAPSAAQLSPTSYDLGYRWYMRRTSIFETQKQMFIGSTSENAGRGLLVSTTDNSVFFIHSPSNLPASATTDASGYDTRSIWDLNVVYQSTTPWLAAVMANTTGTLPTNQTYCINVGTGSYISYAGAKASDDTTDSAFCKIAPAERANGSVASADKPVVIAAVGPTLASPLMNTNVDGSCFRLYKVDVGGATLTEFASSKLNVNTTSYSASGNAKIGNFDELRDLWWCSGLKRMYAAVHRSSGFPYLGVYALYLDESTPASPKIQSLKQELLTTQASLTPYVHKVRTLCINPASASNLQRFYLIVNGSTDQLCYNKIYALPLVNANDATSSSQGAIATKADSNSVATQNNDSWFDQSNDTSNSTYIGLRMVGGGPLPTSPQTPVTEIQVVDNEKAVYVSVAGPNGTATIFRSTATSTSDNAITAWTPWQKISTTSFFKPVVGLGVSAETGGTNKKLFALTQDSQSLCGLSSDSSYPTFDPFAQNAVAIAEYQSTIKKTQLIRSLYSYDSVNAKLSVGNTTATPVTDSILGYTFANGTVTKTTRTLSSGSTSPLYGIPVWDAMYWAPYGSMLVIPHTEYLASTINTGGTKFYALNDKDQAITCTAQVMDNTDVNSRAIKTLAVTYTDTVASKTVYAALAVIPDATMPSNSIRANIYDGKENCMRIFKTTSDGTAFNEVPALKFNLKTIAGDTGLSSGMSFNEMADIWWDDTLKVGYTGMLKAADGTGSLNSQDPGLAMFSFGSDGATPQNPVKILEGNSGYKHIFKVRTLGTLTNATNAADNRIYMLINSSNYANIAGDSSGQANEITNRLYALPIVVSGTYAGRIATSTTHATRATDPSTTWMVGSHDALHIVGGYYLPTHQRARITQILIVDQTVIVSVANPVDVLGECGVYCTTALVDSTSTLVGWTPWKKLGGINSSISSISYNSKNDSIYAVEQDSSNVYEIAWRNAQDRSNNAANYQTLASVVGTMISDLPSPKVGGPHNLASINPSDSTLSSTSYMLAAFNYDTLTLAHLGQKTTGHKGSMQYPHKKDPARYMAYSADSALNSIEGIYHVAGSPGPVGWLFASGYRGVAVLRTPGSGGNAGKGWTGLQNSLADTTSGTPAINAMTWKKITDITEPIYKIVVAGSRVILMGQKKLIGFVATAGKFVDSSPDALNTFSYTLAADDEYMRDVQLVYGNLLLVGTTKGLYYITINGFDNGFDTLTSILYNSRLTGPIGTIAITNPVSDPANGLYYIDFLVASVLKDYALHFQFTMQLTSGALASMSSPQQLRSFTHLEGKIYPTGYSTYYTLPGKHLGTTGAVDVITQSDVATTTAVPTSLITSSSQIGTITELPFDGSRVVSVGGTVYTHQAS